MIALYMRLSAADGDLDGAKAESNSITNQRKILEEFVRKDPVLSAQETMEFVDDGFSGSNLDSPPFEGFFIIFLIYQTSFLLPDLFRYRKCFDH